MPAPMQCTCQQYDNGHSAHDNGLRLLCKYSCASLLSVLLISRNLTVLGGDGGNVLNFFEGSFCLNHLSSLFRFLLRQRRLDPYTAGGPLQLILAPTRELACQIEVAQGPAGYLQF